MGNWLAPSLLCSFFVLNTLGGYPIVQLCYTLDAFLIFGVRISFVLIVCCLLSFLASRTS